MVRALRAKKQKRPKNVEQFDEDDPKAYRNMPAPDKRSSEFYKDKIDEFHDEKIAKLLAHGVQMESDVEELDDEEEVMALDESESEEEEEEEEEEAEKEGTDMESDLEEKKEEDLPNEMAWGTKKKMFYDTDYVATKGRSQEELDAEEQEEEEEAKNIQKRLAENLSEEDYDLNFLQEFAVEKDEDKTVEKQEKIVKDLKQMSQKEKMKLLKKESPELLELIQDFKAKLSELKDELEPMMQMVKNGKIPAGQWADYLETKQQLYLNYCTNISFYLVLKAKRIPAHNHPVIERLLAYRNLINELSAVDARLAPEFRKHLAGDGKEKSSKRKTEDKKTKVPKQKDSGETPPDSSDSDSDLDEEADLRFYKEVEERVKLKRKRKNPEALEENDDERHEELDPDAKRGITYQMAKNKGLTPKRKKIDRNPRVKHREKFRRAKIRRRGQVQSVRKEETRYGGEASGIRAGVKKSTKLK
ncbi:something about silencing protein 10 isoform X2 [Gambusia affinis]|uniref:something about silencing protein 10 isoform X2 n=1 Tax=Gambusia affinis TaxID=33528 RepID=UPI001CDB9424|nr:something about silencing protein 10 isoform X2 [Gambusia affinis]